MKTLAILIVLMLTVTNADAQFLKKLKQKAEDAVTKKIEKSAEKAVSGENQGADTNDEAAITEVKGSPGIPNLNVYSKFDFVPGSTILYFDNFENDNIGEAPLGWITSTSAEVVAIDGLKGNWLKMSSTSAQHITRNKKQSWGNNFTIEFDLLIVKNNYDPRIDINLINTGGNLVTDENILRNDKKQQLIFPQLLLLIIKAGQACMPSIKNYQMRCLKVCRMAILFRYILVCAYKVNAFACGGTTANCMTLQQ